MFRTIIRNTYCVCYFNKTEKRWCPTDSHIDELRVARKYVRENTNRNPKVKWRTVREVTYTISSGKVVTTTTIRDL